MPEVVERKFRGDKVKLDIWRNKKPLTVTIELGTVWPYSYLAHGYDVRIGLEDTLLMPDGSRAPGNADLVAAAARIASTVAPRR